MSSENNHRINNLENKFERGDSYGQITRLCAAVNLSDLYSRRIQVIYLGWNTHNQTSLTTDISQLSDEARETLREYGPVESPEMVRKLYGDDMLISEYVGMTEPIDMRDIAGRVEKDKLRLGLMFGNSPEPVILTIDEVEILDAICENTIIWQEVNANTLYRGGVLTANLMFSLALPYKSKGGNRLLFVLFKSPLENQSNEIAYQRFLMDTIQSLVALDSKQTRFAKKGYESIFGNVLENIITEERRVDSGVGMKTKYGSAFLLVSLFNRLGYIKTTSDRLEEIRKASERGSWVEQIAIVTLEIARNIVTSKNYQERPIRDKSHGMDPLTEKMLKAINQARVSLHASF